MSLDETEGILNVFTSFSLGVLGSSATSVRGWPSSVCNVLRFLALLAWGAWIVRLGLPLDAYGVEGKICMNAETSLMFPSLDSMSFHPSRMRFALLHLV